MRPYITGDKQSYLEPARAFFKRSKDEQRPFRLPKNFATLKDWLHIRIASLFVRFSAFGPSLLIKNPYGLSLYWTMVTSYLVNEGVLNSLVYNYKADGYPPVHAFSAEGTILDGEKTTYINSVAAHHNKEIALSKCLGELLERRFLAMPIKKERKQMIQTSAKSLAASGKDYCDAFTYNRYTNPQKKHLKNLGCDEMEPLLWVRGKNLSKKTSALLPAQTTFWQFTQKTRNNEGLISDPTSSGCAGYMTRTGATVRALKELLQRDAFMCYWHTKSSPRKILLDSIPDAHIQKILAEFKQYNIEIHVLDITTNIALPTIAVVAIDRATARPRLHITAASHVDCIKAITNALYEMYSFVGCFDNGNEQALPEQFQPFITPFGRSERIRYLHGEDMLARVQWFLDGEEITFDRFSESFSAVPRGDSEELVHILSLMQGKGEGYEVYAYESQAPMLRTLGYHAVRVSVPKIMQIYLQEELATLDSDRLHEFAAWKGKAYSPEALLTGVIPPHPFP
ncbi:MAG: YcaO-like family protein [Candidatus Adlerbacteria bacterium]|nr:YcaO-like family protein [Candidatus Adlerbacteria bacterium]